MRVAGFAAALFLGLFGPVVARAQSADPLGLPADKVVLANGLTVLLAPDPHARLVSVVVSYAAGSADDPDGLRGVAHMVEHIAFSRTKHVAHTFQTLEALGACHYNAMTAVDATTYFETVPPERLETALWLESDRMGYAADAVTEERIDAERAVLANEERERHADATLGAVGSFTAHELFRDWHPYAEGPPDAGDLGHIHAKDVLAFLRTWYSPTNATLSIAGAFDRDATVAVVKRYFDGLRSTPLTTRPTLPAWTMPPMRLLVNAPVSYDLVTLSWLTPAHGRAGDAALDLAATSLGGAGNRRLARALVATHLATSVTAHQYSQREASIFVVNARAAPGVDARRVAAAIQDVIDDFARSASADEISAARSLLRQATVGGLETTWGRAQMLVETHRLGIDPGPGFDWGLARYASLDAGQVAQAATKWLTRARRVTTTIVADVQAPVRGMLMDRQEEPP